MPEITPLSYAQANRRALIRMLAETPEQYVIDRMSLSAMLDKVNMEIASLEAGQSDDDLKPCYGTRDQVAKRNRKLTRRCQRLREENARLRETLARVVGHARYEHQRHQNNLRMHDYEMQNIAAGPWHDASEMPPKQGWYLIHWPQITIDWRTTAYWTGCKWCCDNYHPIAWAEIHPPEIPA